MKERIMITSGCKYIDIDAYASIFAYKTLLRSLGYDVYAYTSAIKNESISSLIEELGYKFDEIEPLSSDTYIILDVSNPNMLDHVVNMNNIREVIDHHTGYELFWQEKKINYTIEFIGSVCTLIYEKIIEHKQEKIIDSNLCKLLIAGIVDNTLNLQASITTERDIKAVEHLKELGNIDDSFIWDYFHSCYQHIDNHLKTAINNDLKIEYTSKYLPKVFGQLIVLDGKKIKEEEIRKILKPYSEWLLNIISLKDNKSYLFFQGNKEKLEKLFNIPIKGHHFLLDHFLLRKEIIKKARDMD